MIGPRKTVYVVDDDVSIGRSLQRFFRASGYSVKTFTSGKKFIDYAAGAPLGCVILDLLMPELDGHAVQDALREMKADLPVIFITSDTRGSSKGRAMKHGAADYFQKPFDPVQLLAADTKGMSG